jgi:hypothetical protein
MCLLPSSSGQPEVLKTSLNKIQTKYPIPRLVPTGNLYWTLEIYHPESFPLFSSLGPGPLRFLFAELCPGISIPYLVYQGIDNPFSAFSGLRPWWVGPPSVPVGLRPLMTASLLSFAHSGITPLTFASLLWTPMGVYHLRLNHLCLRT